MPEALWHQHFWTRRGFAITESDHNAPGDQGRFDAVERYPNRFYGYDAEENIWYGPLESKEAAIVWAQARVQTWDAIDDGAYS